MTSFGDTAYAVAAGTALIASAGELGNLYRQSPFRRSTYAVYWSCILVLDALAGCLALALCSATNLPRHAAWIDSWYGWVVIGLSATLIVRANLTAISVGKASVPIGPGAAYGTLRSLVENPLKSKYWWITYGERQGRSKWILDRVDSKNGSLTFSETKNAVCDFVVSIIQPKEGYHVMVELEKEIAAASLNPNEVEQIKQLVTYMSEKNYTTPLYRILGRPTRSEKRSWQIN